MESIFQLYRALMPTRKEIEEKHTHLLKIKNSKVMLKNLHNIPSIELSLKPKFKLCDRPKVDKSNDLYQILMDNWNQNTIGFIEEFKMILLNTSGIVLGLLPVSSGRIGGF